MTRPTVDVFVGLGSNLESPKRQVQRAFDELDRVPHTRLSSCSSLYRSAPLGPAGQPDYINAVARLSTGLAADRLLSELQAIEQAHGRERLQRWGPRTLDIDLLLYGDEVIATPSLTVPHPEMHRRPFVLVPLYELAHGLTLPELGELARLVEDVGSDGLERLEPDDAG